MPRLRKEANKPALSHSQAAANVATDVGEFWFFVLNEMSYMGTTLINYFVKVLIISSILLHICRVNMADLSKLFLR